MSHNTWLTILNMPVFRSLIAAVFALLLIPSAQAFDVKVSGDGSTIDVDFTDEDLGYNNSYIINSLFDWDETINPVEPAFEFEFTLTGEYYQKGAPTLDTVNYIPAPAEWIQVSDPDPDFNQVGVFADFDGIALLSSVDDLWSEVDGCQDNDCLDTKWEALRFSFDRPVTLMEIGFAFAGSSDDFNLTVTNGAYTTHPYIDVTPGNGYYALSVGQSGTDFRIWTDHEDDDFIITGIKVSSIPVSCEPYTLDSDSDGIGEACDNCIYVANTDQTDTDGDGHGNLCDGDFNNTCGPVDFTDLNAFKAAFFTISPLHDLNSSGGPVDFTDLNLFKGLFFKLVGPSGADQVPAPLCP